VRALVTPVTVAAVVVAKPATGRIPRTSKRGQGHRHRHPAVDCEGGFAQAFQLDGQGTLSCMSFGAHASVVRRLCCLSNMVSRLMPIDAHLLF
jgi:hypothetical protein